MAWRIGLLIGWAGALLGLAALDWDGASWYIGAGPPLTVLVGALVNRWWAVLAPLPVSGFFLGLEVVTQANCETCEPMEGGAILVVLGMIFAVPAIAALAIGVALRRLPRRRPPREQHA